MRAETKLYEVHGMTCGHCEVAVAEEISGLPGVTAVEADHRTGIVRVRGERIDDDAVRLAVSEAGYTLAGS